MTTKSKDISTSLSQEVASRGRVRFSFDGIDMELPNPDPVLKKLGNDIEVYREIMSDSTVKGARKRRRSAVVALEHGLEQGDASERTMKLCEQVLASINLNQLVRELHDAVWFGYSPAEIYWVKEKGQWLLEKVIGKPPEWFGFNHENQLCLRDWHSLDFEPVPAYKFVIARNDASYANPYGEAELASVYWYVIFKKGGLKFWLRFADKYGQAFILGKHPRGTPQAEVDLILDSLETLAGSGVGAIPNDGSVEIIESGGKSATSDMFERLLKFCRSEINIALLGQDQSTDSSSTNASAQAGLEVTDDIRDADSEMIATAINDLLRYVVELNLGKDEIVPVWRMWADDEITETQSNIDKNLHEMGVRFNKLYYQRRYKLQDDEFEVAKVNDTASPTEFSEQGQSAGLAGGQAFTPVRLDYAESNVNKLGEQSQTVVDDWLARIKNVVDTAPSIDWLPDLLAREFSELPTDELVEIIQLGMMAGNMAGRAEVQAEADDE